MKFFLSHSSSDKAIVSQVFEELGAAICHYDVGTFDNTSFLPEQIYEALNESTHFILFASKKALESDWVKGELRHAFSNWMKTQIRTAMVFLIDDGDRSQVPGWLQDYVIIEHPTAEHIKCRVMSVFDEWEKRNGNKPPFYRYNELLQLERHVTKDARNVPSALMLCGTDGYGRKQLLNELYDRRFSGASKRKLMCSLDEHESDVNLYRYILGMFGLISPRELSERTGQFLKCVNEDRFSLIAELVGEITKSGQTLLIDVGATGLDDTGKLASWLSGVARKLPRAAYPKLVIISARTPTYLTPDELNVILLQKIPPLAKEESSLLFDWWLQYLEVSDADEIVENFLDVVEGRPKSIEIAARSLATVERNQVMRLRSRITKDIQSQASSLLKDLEEQRTAKVALALISYCGTITEVDLIGSLNAVPQFSGEIESALQLLVSYGFIIQDSIGIKLPGYLARPARDILNSAQYKVDIDKAIEYLIGVNRDIDLSEKTSASTIEEFCIANLRAGVHSIAGVESLILPSQCFRLARQYYDNTDYDQAYTLCETAYRGRIALTEDTALEVLRFKGLSAARLNRQKDLSEVLESFSYHPASSKAVRLHAFIKGFNLRLSGKFDEALKAIFEAYNNKGQGDIHILRELSFLSLAAGDVNEAERLIEKAFRQADNNIYIIQTLIRVSLSKGKSYVQHNEPYLLSLIDRLEKINGRSSLHSATLMRAELFYAIENYTAARSIMREAGNNTAVEILDLKIRIKEGRHDVARGELVKLKNIILTVQEGQRQTSLPEVCDLLVDAASRISLEEGVQELDRNVKWLPANKLSSWKELFVREFAFSRVKPSAAQKKILGLN
ncbi:TIR domain-containing protein [Pseudomonas entomophila]|uniref:toll/interleukin-1 receptor domain-containing protein n=1 Tax=Pseudomonas entomophila TaxID=312306 RepID=UPI0023D8B444|nr:toll/interleukin-1 receptor domain-containing protein [Pseudomonas entomophila]MDF0730184.1 TIR domain-containing protein [Pseudomonas entomophila]